MHSKCSLILFALTLGTANAVQEKPARTSSPPALAQAEALVSTTTPYIQQAIVYTVRVSSKTNVLQFSLDPPTVQGAAIEPLEEQPRTYTTRSGGTQKIVNEYRYALTPLVSGKVDIPATHLSGKAEAPTQGTASSEGNKREVSFQIRTPSVTLQVRPEPKTAPQPWLPLQALGLVPEGEVPRVGRVGEPFTLSLWLRAVGVRGERLPPIAELLQGPDFRIYPENAVEYWQDATTDGNAVRGQRHEILTILPLKRGSFHLPILRIPWWDTNKDRLATLEWQSPEMNVAEEKVPSPPKATGFGWFSLLFSSLFFYWLGSVTTRLRLQETPAKEWLPQIWRKIREYPRLLWERVILLLDRTRPAMSTLVSWMRQRLQPILQSGAVQNLWNKLRQYLAPALLVARLRTFLVHLLPAGVHAQWWARRLQEDETAEAIIEDLREYAATALNMPRNSELMAIAEKMVSVRTEIDEETLKTLFHELEAVFYGAESPTQNTLNVVDWRQRFLEAIRPVRYSREQAPHSEELLPLNPRGGSFEK
ncbi:exported hypothetical protein [Gammaproteobacteria bacterium]